MHGQPVSPSQSVTAVRAKGKTSTCSKCQLIQNFCQKWHFRTALNLTLSWLISTYVSIRRGAVRFAYNNSTSNIMWKMQSEAETGKMSHSIKCSINPNADHWSNSTQPPRIKADSTDALMLSMTLWINPVMLSLTPRLVFLMKVRLHQHAFKSSAWGCESWCNEKTFLTFFFLQICFCWLTSQPFKLTSYNFSSTFPLPCIHSASSCS